MLSEFFKRITINLNWKRFYLRKGSASTLMQSLQPGTVMGRTQSAVVFLGTRLSDEQFENDTVREKTLLDGIETIERNIRDIRVLNSNNLFCSAVVGGPSKSIAELESFLARTGLGHVETGAETPAVRAAGDRV